MTTLGANGRYGNQLMQYGLVRLYAEARGLVAQFPDWIGRDLFDFDDPFPNAKLPSVDEKSVRFFGSLNGECAELYSEIDLHGYFGRSTAQWSRHKNKFRDLFVSGKKIGPPLDRALERLSFAGKTIVAIHIRRGDFGYGQFWIAPSSWYLDWLRALWPELQSPVLYVASDDSTAVGEFAEFSPWCAEKLRVEIPGMRFLFDHHVMRHADHLAIANSSFSFTAAMLNMRAVKFVRPHPDLKKLVPFDPWAADVLLHPTVTRGESSPIEESYIRRFIRPQDSMVYVGGHCSAWTNRVRSLHSFIKVAEVDPGASLDEWRQAKGIDRVDHVVVEHPSSLRTVLEGARNSLRKARIGTIHLLPAEDLLSAEDAGLLATYGYRLYRVTEEGALQAVEKEEPLRPSSYVALAPVNDR
jgi:hypothetical protein